MHDRLHEDDKKEAMQAHEKEMNRISKWLSDHAQKIKSVENAVEKAKRAEEFKHKAAAVAEETRRKNVALEAERRKKMNDAVELSRITSSAFYKKGSSRQAPPPPPPPTVLVTTTTTPESSEEPPPMLPSASVAIAIAGAEAGSKAVAEFFQEKTTLLKEIEKHRNVTEKLESMKVLEEEMIIPMYQKPRPFTIKGDGDIMKHRVLGGNCQPRLFSAKQEQKICDVIVACDKVGFQLDERDLCYFAFQYGADRAEHSENPMYFIDPFRCRLGRAWVAGFRQRNPDITKKMPQNLSKARALFCTKPNVLKWFVEYGKVLDETKLRDQPQRIWNVDESGLTNLQRMTKAFCVKREASFQVTSQEKGQLTTVLGLVNAAGLVMPPLIIFAGKRMQPGWREHAPPDVPIRCTESGYINGKIFTEYMTTWLHWLEKMGRLEGGNILLLDSHYSHVFNWDFLAMMDAHGVQVFGFHPHTTHCTQPLDSHPFKALKGALHSGLRDWNRSHRGQKISKADFFKVLWPAWKQSMTVKRIQAGFRDTGICPFNPEAVNWKKLQPVGSETMEELAVPHRPSKKESTYIYSPIQID